MHLSNKSVTLCIQNIYLNNLSLIFYWYLFGLVIFIIANIVFNNNNFVGYDGKIISVVS